MKESYQTHLESRLAEHYDTRTDPRMAYVEFVESSKRTCWEVRTAESLKLEPFKASRLVELYPVDHGTSNITGNDDKLGHLNKHYYSA